MSTNNTFDFGRFGRLFRQFAIHNNRTILYAAVGYCGVVFLVLFFIQMVSGGVPNGIGVFLPMLLTSVIVFGLLYGGYAFPAFRSKERAFSYLTLPASGLEKFLFELVTRVVLLLVFLPLLYWLIFNIQGWVYELFDRNISFSSIGMADFRAIDIHPVDERPWLQVLILSGGLLVFVLPFTGAAMFDKQPLVKTLFSVAIIIMVFMGVAYIVIEPMGLHNYEPSESSWLIPLNPDQGTRLLAMIMVLANLVMLTVAFLKLKEKEV